MGISRRDCLQCLTGGSIIGLAGCTTRDGSASGDESPPLTFSAEVVRQPSPSDPAQLQVQLENTGSEVEKVRFGQALMFTDNDPSEIEWSDDILLNPETWVGPRADPIQTDDGCWRYPSDEERGVESIIKTREVDPDESLSERYDIYTLGTERECLPGGTHVFQDKGSVHTRDPVDAMFSITMTISEDDEISASADIELLEEEDEEEE